MPRFRSACITWYDYDLKTFIPWADDKCSFWVYGEEICPTTERLHLQVYMEFNDQLSLSTIQAGLPKAHVERRLGTAKEAAGYCKKGILKDHGGKPGGWAYYFDHPHQTWKGRQAGEISMQGRRADLELAHAELAAGKTANELIDAQPHLAHSHARALDRLEDIQLAKKRRSWMTKGLWLYGATGVGKTSYVYSNHDLDDIYVHNMDDKGWWDGYAGQPVVILDDFRGSIPYSQLLKLVDRYPMTVSRRARQPTPFLATHLYITSSMPPEGVYHNLALGDSLAQLYRRFEVQQVFGPGDIRAHVAKPGGCSITPPGDF